MKTYVYTKLYIITPKFKYPKCSPTDEWRTKWWYSPTMEHSSAIKVTIDTCKWMDESQEHYVNKRSQTPKATCHAIPFTENYSTGKTAVKKADRHLAGCRQRELTSNTHRGILQDDENMHGCSDSTWLHTFTKTHPIMHLQSANLIICNYISMKWTQRRKRKEAGKKNELWTEYLCPLPKFTCCLKPWPPECDGSWRWGL